MTYQATFETYAMIPSMSRQGNCCDNAVAKRFFSNLKNELAYHCDFEDRNEARSAVFHYIEAI